MNESSDYGLSDANTSMRKCNFHSCTYKKESQDLWEFRPGRGESCAKRQVQFQEAYNAKDELSLDSLRCKTCWHCRERVRTCRNKSESSEGKCKAFIQELYKNSICELCGCRDNIEFDHIDPSTKKERLGKYDWWSWNGGVDAMKDEIKKCRPLCRTCHAKQPTSCKRKYDSIESLPNETKKEKAALYYLSQRNQKKEYNNKLKLERNHCKDCNTLVTETNCVSFHWAHVDPCNKVITVSNIVRDSKCFATGKQAVDDEVSKCELKCAACHKKETDQRRDLLLY